MTDEDKQELKQYVDDQIKEAIKSESPPLFPAGGRGLPLDSDLVRRLGRIELRLTAVIVAFRELPRELGYWEIFSKTYKTLKTKQQQDVRAGIAELDDLLERD
jgi:hypothetical protein